MLSDNFSPNTLRPIFSHALSLKLETIKLDAFIQNYSQGQTLSGKVIQVLPEQKAVVEFQGGKLLLQFPRPVNSGQNITIRIEQIHPNPILKLTDLSSPNPSHKIDSGFLGKELPSSNIQASDKTSIQNRTASSHSGLPVADKKAVLDIKNGQVALEGKAIDSLSKTDLKQLDIKGGQKVIAEVLKVPDREMLQVRYKNNDLIIKNNTSQKFQPGDPVHIQVKPAPSGKFVLAVEKIDVPSSTARPSPERSILRDYLPVRQPLHQILAGLREVFLEGSLAPLKELSIDLASLKQLQINLQKIVAKDAKIPNAGQLKEMIDRTGFHYEAKIRDYALDPEISRKNNLLENDLKGQLLRFGRELEQLPGGASDRKVSDKFILKLITQVNQAVSNIELQQLIHHFSKEEQQPLLLQLPENLLGEEDRFKIFILPDQQEGAGTGSDPRNKSFNLVFLLNLSALGDLRIETKIFKDEISIHIMGSNSGAVEFIQAHVPELENVFRQEGFSIDVRSSHPAEISMEIPDSLGQLLVDTPLQIVDLKT